MLMTLNLILLLFFIYFPEKISDFEPSMKLFSWSLHEADLQSVLYYVYETEH